MFTSSEAFLIAAGAVLVVLLLVEGIARLGGGSFVTSVIMGQDNRTSTSKTFVLMWTLLIAWGLISLLLPGEIVRGRACAAGSDIQAGINSCQAAGDQVGLLQLSWRQFLSSGLSAAYLVLLAIPATAAVVAKGITQTKTDQGTLVKVTAPAAQGIAARATEIFSADDQTTDIGDFQYVVFNLVTAAYFIAEFLKITGKGLPVIPDTLLGLTSVSAALYVGKKAATRNQPTISGVFPAILRANQPFTITGSGLTTDPNQPPIPGQINPQVAVNGAPATNVQPDPNVADRLTAVTPPGLIPAGAAPVAGTVEVLSSYGVAAPPYSVQLA